MVTTASRTASGEPAWLDLILDRPAALLIFLAFHGVLGVAFRIAPGFSKVHGLLTLVVGLAFCLYRRKPQYWVYLSGYIIAGEVLWKMTRGALLWEQGKYFLILIMALAMFQTGKAGNPMAFVQFLLLLPSAVITCVFLPLSLAREALSFNLSGPLSLCVATMFLSAVQLTTRQLCKLCLLMLGPLFGIALVIIYNMSTVPIALQFGNSSNYFVTGGFGPNQVSAALGLGILLCFFLILIGRMPVVSRLALGAVLILVTTQAALTFSRNGIYCGLGASLVAAPLLLTDSKSRNRFLLAVPVLIVIFGVFVLPRLNDFTDGQLINRFEQTSGSGRDEILSGELELWKQNPLFGVGPGVGRYVRGDVWEAAAHTEFTRLLAEHGMLGLASLLFYPIIFADAFRSAKTRVAKAIVIATMAWSFSFMLVNAMRMAAPAFMFGLACARLRESERRPVAGRRLTAQRFSVPVMADRSPYSRV